MLQVNKKVQLSHTALPYWGKADAESGRMRPLWQHCLDCAAVLGTILDRQPLIPKRCEMLAGVPFARLKPLLLFLAAIHDIGKFALAHQFKVEPLAMALGLRRRCMVDAGHVACGWWLWREKLPRQLQKSASPVAQALSEPHGWAKPLLQAALGHHGAPVGWDGLSYFDAFSQEAIDAALAYADAAFELFLADAEAVVLDEEATARLSWLVAGLMVTADWLASHQDFFPADALAQPACEGQTAGMLAYLDSVALPTANRALEASGILRPGASDGRRFHDLFPSLPQDAQPYPLQAYALDAAVADCGPQLHIFEDLTGNGKTEASLACAHRLMLAGLADGVYLGLPTMATANAMYARLAREYEAFFVNKPSLLLAHGSRNLVEGFRRSAGLCDAFPGPVGLESMADRPGRALRAEADRSEGQCTRWLADNRKKALLAPFGVGTLDQALLGVLASRHQSLRLAGLCRGVLIADEVHGYDPYTHRLLCGLLTFQAALGGSAILLSATLPAAIRQQLVAAWWLGRGLEPQELPSAPFPLALRATDHGVAMEHEAIASGRRIDVVVELTAEEGDIVSRLADAALSGACACWVRNTVDDAVHAWEALRATLQKRGGNPGDVILHHARFALADRLATEERVLKVFGKGGQGRAGKILCGTTVLQESLDYDVDLMASDLAPMEALIQRVGRCHRHEQPRPPGYERPRLLVLSPDPVDDAPADWYAALFPKAAYVYRLPCLLWRTARLLRAEGCIRLPQRARALVDGVYADGPDDPPALRRQDDIEWSSASSLRTIADFNLLTANHGYGGETRGFKSDDPTPTRQGEATVQARLLRVTLQGLELWAGGTVADSRACALSEVRVYARRLAIAEHDPHAAAVADLASAMPDKGQRAVLLLLELHRDEWRGRIRDGHGRLLEVCYGEAGLVMGESGSLDRALDLG